MRRARFAIVLPALLELFACRPREPSLGERALAGTQAEAKPAAGARSTAKQPPKAVSIFDDDTPSEEEMQRRVASMLERVSKARGLAVKHAVPLRVLGRPAMLERIRRQVKEGLPGDLFAHQGMMMRLLGFAPPDYDYEAGSYRLIESQIAGFYMPDDGTMYLAEDLSDAEADETLSHELVHALQDQHFDLAPMTKYAPGDGDRITAVHALVEGDATSAMLDISVGSAFAVSETMLSRILSMSTAMSEVGVDTPRMIRESLTLPYSDGFRFVQELRRRGQFGAVDAAYRSPPATTEQLMHIQKYLAKEPALEVQVPPAEVLGEGFQAVFDDVAGEQGLKLSLEEWVFRDVAKAAAEGWGGDRMVLYRGPGRAEAGKHRYVVVWHIRMDTDEDGRELFEVLEKKMPKGCMERAAVGPLAYAARGREAVIVAGPHEEGTAAKEACGGARKWAGGILRGRAGK